MDRVQAYFSSKTLELLLDTHFPTSTDFSERMDYNGDLPIQLIEELTSKEKIMWAIDSFKPFKSWQKKATFLLKKYHHENLKI